MTESLHTTHALGWGAASQDTPVPPRTLPHPGGRGHLTARSFRELILRVQGRRLLGSTSLHQGQVAKELLCPWAQGPKTGLPSAQTPCSKWSTRACPSGPLVSPEQPGVRLSAQGAGDTCLATGPLFLPGAGSLASRPFPRTRPTVPSLLQGSALPLPQTCSSGVQ